MADRTHRPDPEDTWTFVLTTPDAVIGDKFAAVVDVLESQGLRSTVCRIIELNLDLIRGVYGGGTQWFIGNPGGEDVRFSLEFHERLYGVAPACLVMFHAAEGGAHQRALGVKGRTWPEISSAGTVRHLGENVVFNLIHSPDDPSAARRELRVLVGAGEAERLHALNRSGDERLLDMLGRQRFHDCAPAFHGWEATSFPAIANKLHRRVAQRIGLVADVPPAAVAALVTAVELLDEQRAAIAKATVSVDRMVAAQSLLGPIASSLSEAAEAAGDEVLLAGIRALADLHDLYGVRDLEPIHAMRTRGLYIAPVETVILATHHFSFRPNDHLRPIYGGSAD